MLEVLCGICKECDFKDQLVLLLNDFEDLNDGSITFPGHQGYGSTLAHTSLPVASSSFTDIRFQKVIRLINVFWKLPLSLNLIQKNTQFSDYTLPPLTHPTHIYPSITLLSTHQQQYHSTTRPSLTLLLSSRPTRVHHCVNHYTSNYERPFLNDDIVTYLLQKLSFSASLFFEAY